MEHPCEHQVLPPAPGCFSPQPPILRGLSASQSHCLAGKWRAHSQGKPSKAAGFLLSFPLCRRQLQAPRIRGRNPHVCLPSKSSGSAGAPRWAQGVWGGCCPAERAAGLPPHPPTVRGSLGLSPLWLPKEDALNLPPTPTGGVPGWGHRLN